jgi:hypothetical protein
MARELTQADIAASVPMPKQIDMDRGAPAAVRRDVGGAPNPQARLATMRRYYPDAEPYGDDNFVFTDPDTGRPTLYNPPGPDWGDVPAVLPEIAEAVGGVFGGALATPPALAAAPATGGASLLGIPAGVGLGAAGGKEIENLIASNLYERVDPRGLPERVVDAAGVTALNFAGHRLGEVAPTAVKKLLGGGKEAAQRLRAFQRLGVTPRAGAVTGSAGIQSAEHAAAVAPGGAGVMQQAYEKTLGELTAASKRISGKFGPILDSPQRLGTHVRAASEKAANRFMDNAEVLYNHAYRNFDRNTPVDITPIADALEGVIRPLATSPRLLKRFAGEHEKLLADFMEDATGGTVTFAAVRQIRTAIGKKLNSPLFVGNEQHAAYASLYGALTKTLDDTIASKAGPAAQKAWGRANQWYAKARANRIDFLNDIAKKELPEQVAKYIQSGMNDGGTLLTKLRKSLLPEEFDAVAGTVLHQLGRAKPNAQSLGDDIFDTAADFSPNTFMTNWAKLAPESKKALFGGTRYAKLRPQLDDLAKVSAALKDADKFRNYSNTARNVLWGSLFTGGGANLAYSGGLEAAAAGAAGAVTLGFSGAKLLTSPRFVRWITDGMRTVGDDATSFNRHLTRLISVQASEPHLKEELQQYRDAMRAVRRQ